ncbi:MAG TPA: CapA family protein [Micromonosporaceae bacterium]|nr:CapA family protein [Micromonosporaceae bacterium]
MKRVAAAVTGLVLAAALAACGTGSDTGTAVGSRAGEAVRSPGGASPAPTGSPEITLAFAGDVHFMVRTLTLLDDPPNVFGPIASVLSSADFAMVNLESAVTDRGTEQPKRYHFRAPPTAYQAVKAAGVDLVTLANNHALDYGQVGLADTLAAAKAANMPYVGAGVNAAQAYAPYVTEVKGVTFAFLGFNQFYELWQTWNATATRPGIAQARDLARAVAAAKAARKLADVLVVYVHWGNEGDECPTQEQRAFAAEMSKAGAGLVVGTHAHLLMGDGWMGRTYVQYGLGNFIWYHDDAWSNDTGVLRVTMRGKTVTKTELVPAVISRTTGQPLPVTGTEAARIQAKYAALRACTKLAAAPAPGG